MTNKFIKKREKIRAQVKSRFYYLFWGTATLSVVAGQIYLGTSYRAMARSMNRWFEETIDIITMPRRPSGIYQPMPSAPEDYDPSKSYPIIR
tara:strand:+ start:2076 stop:2351 length:276 start_codon:yes stop_codon:yes gene_type:complete